jgi:hypothetical protein
MQREPVNFLVSVDSASRENPTQTTPSDYTVTFNAVRSVYALRVVDAIVPATQYTVHPDAYLVDFYDAPTATPHHRRPQVVVYLHRYMDTATGVEHH